MAADDFNRDVEELLQLSWTQRLRLWPALGVLRGKAPIVKTILSRFWNDPAYFIAAVRAGTLTFSQLVTSGVISAPGVWGSVLWWIAQAAPMVLIVPAGQTNPTSEQVKAVANDATIPASQPSLTATDAPMPSGKP